MRHQHPTLNVFTPTFLVALEPEDDSLTVTEAAVGPWTDADREGGCGDDA